MYMYSRDEHVCEYYMYPSTPATRVLRFGPVAPPREHHAHISKY